MGFPKGLRSLAIGTGAVTTLWFGYRAIPYRFRQPLFFDSPFNELRFDGEAWRRNDRWQDDEFPVKQSVRGMMLEDLMTRHLRKGRSRKSVRALLGPADYREPEADDETYSLGAWSGFRMDDDRLTIHYDPQGTVRDFYAWQS